MAVKKKAKERNVFLVVFPDGAFTEDDINKLKQDFDDAGIALIAARYSKLAKVLPEFIQIEI